MCKGALQPPEGAELQQPAVLFEKRHLPCDQFPAARGQPGQVHLIAEGAEEGHVGPGGQRGDPPELVVGHRRYMGPHAGNRVDKAGAVLDLKPFHRVGVVAGPALGRIVEHAGVKPRPARRAGLKQNPGKPVDQPLVEPVNPQDIPVQHRALPFGAGSAGESVADAAVHIPFDVADRRAVQQRRQPVVEVIHHRGVGTVQHILVAAGQGAAAGLVQHPVGVFLPQPGAGVDHLRLNPQPELQAHGVELLPEAFQPAWQLGGVHFPVAQAGLVAAAVPEPAVVQHKKLNAQRPGFGRQRQQLLLVEVKIGGFPVVDQDRPDRIAPDAPGQPAAVQGVESL